MTLSDLNGDSPSDVDFRRFRYVLEPVAQRQRWRLAAAQARLAEVQGEVKAAQAQLAATEAERTEVAAMATAGLGDRIDPQARRLILAGLLQLDRRHQTEQQALQALEETADQMRKHCVDIQLRLKGMERHRIEQIQSFAQDERRRHAADNDREWLARRSFASAVRRSA